MNRLGPVGSDQRGAVGAAARAAWYLLETLRAFLRLRLLGLLTLEAIQHHRHRHDDEEIDDGRHEQEGDDVVDEVAVLKLAVVDREAELGKIRLAADGGDERRQEIFDKALNHAYEGSADDEADRHIDDIASEEKLLEAAERATGRAERL